MHSLYFSATSSTLDVYNNNYYLSSLPNQEFWLYPLIYFIFPYAEDYVNRANKTQLTLHFIKENLKDIPKLISKTLAILKN